MQPYERIGLVALLFLIVLVTVGALWDDGPTDDVLAGERSEIERVDEEAAVRAAAAEAQQAERIRLAQETVRGAGLQRPGTARQMPMGGQDEVESEVSRVTTLSNGSDHRSAPLDLNAPRTGAEYLGGARAQDPEELQDFARPNRRASRNRAGEAVSMNARSDRRRKVADATRAEVQEEAARPAKTKERAATAAPAAGTKPRTYTVRSGDALQRIAKRELGDSSLSVKIASLNGLTDPDMIRAGMVLTLPTSSSSSGTARAGASAAKPKGTAPSGAGRSYKIRSGESLSAALTRELGTYRRSIALVKALNPGLNPDRVRAGQVIYLPRIEDIPAGPKGSRPSAAPVLSTSTGRSTVAAAERPSARSNSRSNSEFVVR